MAIKPADILATAKALAVLGDEAGMRSAASRAYYAAYHCALAFADARGLDPMREVSGDHPRLIARFERYEGDATIAACGYVLTDMRRVRVMADYQPDEEWLPARTELQIAMAELLLQRLG